MAKPLKSQWDFGELFAPEAFRRILTVSQLTASVKRLLEQEIGQVWVTGEITNLRVQSSGHAYFSLKDASAQLSCVLFRGEAPGFSRDLLNDGQKVILQGDLTVYEVRGQYQLRVTTVELQGVGALQVAFEKLKQKLSAEGLFAAERKRPLPPYPRRVGVVTSPTGAALRDVIHVVERRNPSLELILAPCRVQGQGASDEVAAAIRLLNEWASVPLEGLTSSAAVGAERQPQQKQPRLDLILVTRGGGSLEDLWAFNEEVVARAIFESALPVVSAVGHEIDFTISDFVADLRAATPSVAAELITEGVFSSREFVANAFARLRDLVQDRVEAERENVRQLRQRLGRAHPRRRLQEQSQRLDDLQTTMFRCAKFAFRERLIVWQAVRQRLLRLKPSTIIDRRREQLGQLRARGADQARARLVSIRSRLENALARLRLLSPDNVLERGYSITMDAASGKVIRAAAEVRSGQPLRTRLKSGEVRSVVEK
ncbi:MAG: exodeoxyribonuclease VII large subunit [Verrucomicrobia bacterium]|nr:exodeoxyribonuclease VII large subunit [Verrucomicrobiota bacterium]